jgi:hypothetical protein
MGAIQTKRIVAMAFVADVLRSISFYEHLGFSVENSFTPPDTEVPIGRLDVEAMRRRARSEPLMKGKQPGALGDARRQASLKAEANKCLRKLLPSWVSS